MNNTAKARLFLNLWNRSLGTLMMEIFLGTTIFVSTILGNLLVIFAAYKGKKPRNISHSLIISMAVSDFLMAALCEPLSFAILIGVQNNWTLGTFMCQFQGFFVMLLSASSVFNVTLVGINRYLLVVRPILYRTYLGQKAANLAMLVVWLISGVPAVAYLANGNKFHFHPGKLLCFIQFGSCFEIFWPMLGAASLLVMVPCYVCVYRCMLLHTRRIFVERNRREETSANLRRHVEEIRLTKTLMAVVLGFSLCWSIVIITDSLDFIQGEYSLSRTVYLAHTYTAATSSAINPYIYGFANRRFREQFKRTLNCNRNQTSC